MTAASGTNESHMEKQSVPSFHHKKPVPRGLKT